MMLLFSVLLMVFYLSKHVLSPIQCKHCAVLLKLHMKHSVNYLTTTGGATVFSFAVFD